MVFILYGLLSINIMKSIPCKRLTLLLILSISFFFSCSSLIAQSITLDVDAFKKVIVSPHIEVTFKKGDKQSVIIESISEPIEKLRADVKNKTLELFLDGAKVTTKSEKESENRRVPLYNGTVVKATVIYKDVETFSLRGEERFLFESPIDAQKITLNIYGESEVYLNEVTLKELKVSIYGESFLKIDKGEIDYQQIRAYGESNVNLLNVMSKKTKITAYGDGSFQFNVSEELKVTSYGEPTVTYKGDAKVKQGLSFGEVSIVKMN